MPNLQTAPAHAGAAAPISPPLASGIFDAAKRLLASAEAGERIEAAHLRAAMTDALG